MRIVFPRVSTKLITLILTLAMLSSSLPLVVSLAAAQPKITWSEKQLSLQLSPGSGEVRQVTFTSDHNLQDVTIEAVSEIADLVSVQPATIASVFADQSQSVSLFFSIPAGTSFGLHEGTIHVRTGSQTFPQTLKLSIDVAQSADLPAEIEPLSPAVVSLSGVSEPNFNPTSNTVQLGISGGTFNTDPANAKIFLNGVQVSTSGIQATSTVITFSAQLFNGINQLSFFGFDAEGRIVHKAATLWAGSFSLFVSIKDENNQPASGASVTARLGDDKEVKTTATSVNGGVTFANLPNRTIILEASASGNRIASVATTGNAGFEELKLKAFNAPSDIDNNDLSQGTAGWNIGTAPVQIIPHNEGTFVPLESASAESSSVQQLSALSSTDSQSRKERAAEFAASSSGDTGPSLLALADLDQDLVLNTSGEGPESISRTFQIEEGVQEIKVRYKFVTSEVPGGFFGTQFNDYFNIAIRSQSGGGSASESQTMNGLGLAAFDGGGATDWREFTLPVNETTDTIQLDLTVANVADGLFDSSLVVDFVAKPKVKISELKAVIKNDKESVTVTVSPTNPAPNITLTLSTRSGTGSAQFTSNNSTTMTITQTTNVEIQGLMESDTRDNIRIEAKDDQGKKLDDEDFSVLWVTISIRTSGSISSDNSARSAIGTVQGSGSPTLGPLRHTGATSALGAFWGNAVELVGTVAPKNFNEKIILDRARVNAAYYFGTSNTLETSNSGGARSDTSNATLRDDDPRPNGKIYDYDAPGLPSLPASTAVGTPRRQRFNARQFAMYNGKKASDDFFWFARITIVKTAGTDVLGTDVPGDNVAGQGSTPTTWNLQP
jgi:hypothetical protein